MMLCVHPLRIEFDLRMMEKEVSLITIKQFFTKKYMGCKKLAFYKLSENKPYFLYYFFQISSRKQ